MLTFVLLMVCQRFGIDLSQNLWLISLPIIIAVGINILFIELYDRLRRK